MTSTAAASAALVAYRGVWRAAEPFITWFIRRKDLRRGVLPAATAERFGYSSPPAAWQPHAGETNFTLWIHGASVGECLSALPLIELVLSGALRQRATSESSLQPRTRVVLSTTTPAARELLRKRLAALPGAASDARCVFAPMDHPVWVERFLDAWQPDAGLWIESELWPTLVHAAAARRMRLGVVNGRLSDRSFTRWQLPLAHSLARSLVGAFSLVLCQDETNARRFRALGASTTDVLANLKFAAQQRASDSDDAARITSALVHRIAWLAVSTHDSEELAVTATHVALAAQLGSATQLLTCIIPRHPDRTSAIVTAINAQYPALEIALRSRDVVPRTTTAIFIVDTIGETALFCDAIATVFVGGTFVPRGGHNPIEPLRAGCRVFVGPHMHNFEDIIEQIRATASQRQAPDAVRTVRDAAELAVALQQHFATRNSLQAHHDEQQQAMMRTLAVQSLQSHERALLTWLAADGST